MTTLEEFSGGEEDETFTKVPVELTATSPESVKPILAPKNLREMFTQNYPGITWDDALHKEKCKAEWKVIADAYKIKLAKWKEDFPELAKAKRPKKKKADKKKVLESSDDDVEIKEKVVTNGHKSSNPHKRVRRELEMISRDLTASHTAAMERIAALAEEL